ncbi:MAG: hypothetical protein U5L10_03000 [Candidatus Moranbacteria bacterium]|nr:hypothetical protein [Candidatus Moranbacteria bacterium]
MCADPCKNFESLLEVCQEQLVDNSDVNFGLVIYSSLRRKIIAMFYFEPDKEDQDKDMEEIKTREDGHRKNRALRHYLHLCEENMAKIEKGLFAE